MPATTEHPDSLKTSELSNLGSSSTGIPPQILQPTPSRCSFSEPSQAGHCPGDKGDSGRTNCSPEQCLDTKGMGGAAQKSALGTARQCSRRKCVGSCKNLSTKIHQWRPRYLFYLRNRGKTQRQFWKTSLCSLSLKSCTQVF